MSWLKQVFGLQLSQKTKVYYDKSKEEGDQKEEEHQISDLKTDKGNNENSQESDNSWFSSWSGLSTTFDLPKGKKREFSNDDEEEEKWSSFCSKEKNESKSESFFSTQVSSSSQSTQATNIPIQTCVYKDDNKDDNKNDDEDDSKVEFFPKVGKYKKIKFF